MAGLLKWHDVLEINRARSKRQTTRLVIRCRGQEGDVIFFDALRSSSKQSILKTVQLLRGSCKSPQMAQELV